MAVAANALCTLANALTYMGMSSGSDDALIESIIDAVSDQVEAYLGYGIASASYSRILPVRDRTIVLPDPDVTAISFLGLDTTEAMRVKYSGTDTNARVAVRDADVQTISRVGATSTTTTSTFAANVTTAAMVTTIDAISGWDATLVESLPSAYLIRVGPVNAKDVLVSLEAWEDYDDEYEFDPEAGTIRFVNVHAWHPAWSRVRVEYTAGASAIPDDIEQVAIEMVRRTYANRGKDEPMQSESLGDYSYSRAQSMMLAGNADDWWKARLAPHMRLLP